MLANNLTAADEEEVQAELAAMEREAVRTLKEMDVFRQIWGETKVGREDMGHIHAQKGNLNRQNRGRSRKKICSANDTPGQTDISSFFLLNTNPSSK